MPVLVFVELVLKCSKSVANTQMTKTTIAYPGHQNVTSVENVDPHCIQGFIMHSMVLIFIELEVLRTVIRL